MSTTSGIGSKGEKNKSKFKSIDINNLYKGKSVETQKSTVPRQHGLQSLGKVSSVRRMPPPANLPSLKSENSGNDPSISLVPSGGSGWVSKEEKKETSGSGAQPLSSQPQPAVPTQPLAVAQQQQQQQQQQQVAAAAKTNIPPGGPSSAGIRSWSKVTVGGQKGGLVSHQSPLFQEEFPSLAQEEKNKEQTQTTKKDEDNKDTQYGPGPSLRPQNVASWREGGGRAVPQPKPEEPTATTQNLTAVEMQPNGPPMSGGGGGSGGGEELHSQPSLPTRPGPPHGAMPLGPHMGMPPQYRSMMPAYMFRGMPGGYPPNFPGFRPPYPHEARFRGPPPSMASQRHMGAEEDGHKRPAIISEKALKDFDEILKSDKEEGGWAGPQGEIDYSEKLVFSDEEDDSRGAREHRMDRRRPPRVDSESQDKGESEHAKDSDRKEDKDKDEPGPPIPREAWPHVPPPPHYRGGPGPRPPHPGMDARGWPPPMLPYEFMGHRGAPPYPFRMPPPHAMRAPYPGHPPPVSSPGAMPGPIPPSSRKMGDDDDELWRTRRKEKEGEINTAVERARHRREENEKRKDNEQRAAAAEKLRQLDERTKKKDATKESDSEGRDSRTVSESSDKDLREPRYRDRPSSATSPQGELNSKGYTRSVPPRFQKQQDSMMGSGSQGGPPRQPPSPGSGGPSSSHQGLPVPQGFRPGQSHPPPHWPPYDPRDPRAWGGMHHFMNPQYGPPRPPLDMQGMPMYVPPMPRRRNDSHGSGNEAQDSDQYERPDPRSDPRAAWLERGYPPPPPPHPSHFEDMRRHSFYDQRMYHERYDFDRREYERPERDEDSHGSEGEPGHKEMPRPTLLQRDSFEDRNKSLDNEDRKSDRSGSKNSADWELNRSLSKESNKEDSLPRYDTDDFNQEFDKDTSFEKEDAVEPYVYRRDGRQGPTPKFRAYSSSDELQKREASQRDNAKIPAPPQDQGKVGSIKSSMTSLKRSASNMSSSSAASSDKDRKSDSPKESIIFERSQVVKKDTIKEVKETKVLSNDENKPPDQPRPNAWEIKEQDRQRAKEKENIEVKAYLHEEEGEDEGDERHHLSDNYGNDRVESPFGSRPPVKKKRDDGDRHHFDDRDRDRRPRSDVDRFGDRGDKPRGVPSRGREFVRGRGMTRNRGGNRGGGMRGGSYNTRNASRGNGRDYYSASYDRGSNSSSNSRRPDKFGKPYRYDDDGGFDREDNKSGSSQRHGPAEELSDISGDEVPAKHGDIEGSSRESRDSRQQQTRGSDSSRDEKTMRDLREPKTAWNNEPKQPRPLAQPPAQNPWTKNQPLLPDPPRSERITDVGTKDMKNEDKPRGDAWHPQDSRHNLKDIQRSDLKDSHRQDRENHRQDIKDSRQELRDNQQHDIRDNQRQDSRDPQRQDPKVSQRQESRDFQRREARDGQYPEPRDTRQDSRDSRQESKDNRPERDAQRQDYRDMRQDSREAHRQEVEKSGDSQVQNPSGEVKERQRYDRRDDRDKDKDNRRRQDKEGGNRRNDRDRYRGDDGGRIDFQDGDGKEKVERRERDQDRERYKDRRNDRDMIDENGQLIPRGEPSRRGRGGSASGAGSRRGRGGRFTSAPSTRGGAAGGQQGGGYGGRGEPNLDGTNGRHGNGPRNHERSSEGRDGRMEGSNQRRDNRRQDNRNQPPPRFRRGGGMGEGRGRGSDRGNSGWGRPGRGRGGSAPATLTNKKPILTKQASNEGEEWETASESSEPKNDVRESRDKRENTSKKNVSNQRPFGDRQNNRRPNTQDSRNSVERRNTPNKDNKQNQKNGAAPPKQSAANGTTPKTKAAVTSTANHKENVVYRVDSIVPNDPNAINNAINNARKQISKKPDTLETAKLKSEKEKKDALANIDINNIAGVVVVDDLQEVTTDDPNFLFESNDGFQEVTSKRTLKIKQKLEAEQKKTEKEAQKKREHLNKVVARPKGLSPKSGRSGLKGSSKLPPRLAKQREQREKDQLTKATSGANGGSSSMPKIEQWDNELASHIPSLLAGLENTSNTGPTVAESSSFTAAVVSASSSTSVDETTDLSHSLIVTNKSSASMMASLSLTPAPVPTISAWSKPINFAHSTSNGSQQPSGPSSQQAPVVVPADMKLDKGGDQHDSGIDVSDQPNSPSSSTRSSPSGDSGNKLIISTNITHSPSADPSTTASLKKKDGSLDSKQGSSAPKPQRPQKTIKNEKVVVKADVGAETLKKMDMVSTATDISISKPEPIQMPPSFKDSIFGKSDDTNLQLDFHYDESLASSMHEQPSTPEKVESSPHPDSMNLSAPTVSPQAIVSPTSPATEDLSSKIASVKNCWDPLPASLVSGKPSPNSSTNSNNANTNNANAGTASSNSGAVFFGHEVTVAASSSIGGGDSTSQQQQPHHLHLGEDMVGPTDSNSGAVDTSANPASSPVVQRLNVHAHSHSPHPAESVMLAEMEMTQTIGGAGGIVVGSDDKSGNNVIMEPTNVCKVRPQQLQMSVGSQEPISMLSSGMSGHIPSVGSPPLVLASQHPFQAFQLGSQFVPPEQRFNQPSFGFSLSQAQAPGAAFGQHTSLFVPSTPSQQAEFVPASQLGYPPQQQQQPQQQGRTHTYGGQPPSAAAGAAAPPPLSQQQPSTIMVSSATSALMSTNIKAPGPSHAPGPVGHASAFSAEPLGKSLAPSQIYGSSSMPGPPPSQQLFFFDPNPPLGQLFQPHSQLIGGSQPNQNMGGSSQIIGSQLLQTRTPVQPSSSFFQQAPTASFYPAQAPSSAIQVGLPSQGPIQQASNQFSLQSFSGQPHNLGLALQPTGPATIEGGPMHQTVGHSGHTKAGPPSGFGNILPTQQPQQAQQMTVGSSQQHMLAHGQLTSSRRNQIKSPPQNQQQPNSYMSNTGSNPFSQGQLVSANKPYFGNSSNSSSIPASSGIGTSSSSLGMGSSHHNMSSGMSSGINNMSTSSGSYGGQDRAPPASVMGSGKLSSNSVGVSVTMGDNTSGPPTGHPQSSISRNQPQTSGRYLNPNAPNFPPTTKYGASSSAGTNPSAPPFMSSVQHQPTGQQMNAGPNHQSRPQAVMGGHVMRPSTPQGQVPNTRPAFPNPIQRPGGPSVTSAPPRPPSMQQQFNNGPNQGHLSKSGGGTNMMPPNKSGSGNNSMPFNKPVGGMMPPNNPVMNQNQQSNPGNGGGPNALNMMGGSAFLSSLINAAQAIMQGATPNPYNVKGPGHGGFAGPNRGDVAPQTRQGPHTSGPQGPSMKAPGGPQQAPPPSSSSTKPAPGSYPGYHGPNHPNSLKAQQAQQRQAVLNAAANFFNSNTKTSSQSKPPASSERTPATSSQNTSGTSKTEEKKPALQMVSNPSLVGTSVKINLSASSNTRAPAIPTVSVASTGKAEAIPSSGKKEESSLEGAPTEGDNASKAEK
ncbi:protein PRRC2C [Elysia marginata]|uniref:Protein PRRC2C n=1 Tax=Elysia marginata TaxID=1093978 RepID=A0AAV4I013_9GAST|nr:protein PRRC2C [Elysia marginata]